MRWPAAMVLIIASLFLVAFTGTTHAEIDWQNNCTSGVFWRNATLCYGASCYNLTQPPVTCAYGCSDNGLVCNSSDEVPSNYILLGSLLFVITAALSIFVGYKIGNNDGATKTGEYISFMFFGVGIILIIVAMGLMGSFFTAKPNDVTTVVGAGYILFVGVFVILIAIFLIEYLVKHVEMVNKKKGYR